MANHSNGKFAPPVETAKTGRPIVETPARVDDDWPTPGKLPETPAKADSSPSRVKLLATTLAASIVVAVAVSAAAGSLDVRALMRMTVEYGQTAYNLVDELTAFRNVIALQNTPAPQTTGTLKSVPEQQNIDALHNSYALRLSIDQLQTDLSALKFGVDVGARSTNWQFDQIEDRLDRIENAPTVPAAKIARTIERLDRIENAQAEPAAKIARTIERLDRIEQAQAEPAAKIARTIERLDRLERRVDAIVDPDSTGSITTRSIAPRNSISTPTPAPRPQAAKPSARSQRPVVGGWVVSDVYGNTAYIRDNNFSTIAVTTGATIPGLGRVDAIRQQNGRWVVVTARGLIVSAH